MQSNVEVILPDRPDPARPIPALYLLHGLSDDHTIWQRRTSVERYAGKYYLAVIMPNGHRSFYTDSDDGHSKYFTYVSEELPSLMESFFPLCRERDGRFVAGLSMGGYGAFKCALTRPDRYRAAASLSGVMSFPSAWERLDELKARVSEDMAHSPQCDLRLAAELAAHSASAGVSAVPDLFQFCGTEDFLYEENLAFRDCVRKCGLSLEYREGPGGHSWDVWDERIRDVLEWLPLSGKVAKTGAIGI